MSHETSALGPFLRSRRDRLTPARAGITATPGPRRVPGLRKEELAALAGLSVDHYSRLEQGRQPRLSNEVLEALSRALQLDDVEHAHLKVLAEPVRHRDSGWEAAQRPDPGLLRMMTTLEHVPTLLLGRRAEVLARSRLVESVLGTTLTPPTSFLRWLLLDPAARERILNWSDFAVAAVGGLRVEVGRRPRDRRLTTLVAELRATDSDVDRWWNAHGVADRTSLTKRIAHPDLGPLEFDIETVTTPHDPDQRLVVYTVEPGSPTARMLPLLASWSPDPGEETRSGSTSPRRRRGLPVRSP